MSRAEYKRMVRAKNIALGLRSDGKERARARELSRSRDAELKRVRRAAFKAQGLNSDGRPYRYGKYLHPERDQRSWWLVTTQCPDPVSRLISATKGWASQRFWSGDRLHPYQGETNDQAA